ncbi:hypothetical protein GCM10011409_44350 [Lentibacillus populi]|uniref:Uncharacterized protein n=1 Tax=Lentibacillus populi TaxID=1827502 RepID=A0A9W5U1X5_9BACI|nr:hypothetical protein [Lentibacillus populi]GGB62289.1 hypothetical protein GCM10011409_44350 [Lentibacillus populi]
MSNNSKVARRIYTDPRTGFTELINLIIHNKIDEMVNNANKENLTSSQYNRDGFDIL